MSGTIAGLPATQWEWHEAHRDLAKNMYRTSYSDMSHGREAHVRSDYPSGYGGHIPSLRHDVLHRNTSFDRSATLRRNDPSRDSHPSFLDQISGIPTVTKFPSGARKNPTSGVVQHDGTTTTLKPPWGVLTHKTRQPLNYRFPPPNMRRTASSPALGDRANRAAKLVGAKVATGPDTRASTGAGEQNSAQDMGRLSSPDLNGLEVTPRPRSSGLEKTMQGFNFDTL
mmetsp:Transcript_22836/g.44389  ORF Transcript_22836/g.44389 Transcript_22836/m.44389 type:complete len:226 (-) Transcript_22836:94-771(-)|eukprot:CAMPEP_0172719308 /NCGR_PEP_ID=MMETSP1074-20121228/75431_1 /TAXON_ID=2916 /ORGANISM="Ceratium fusus, Strain PA161109" /LENGTH=225 /DNA_ID=CAMNT_0013544647 /DNA_START=56 /DNA_END=733 /DNA_ORIENTATION=+